MTTSSKQPIRVVFLLFYFEAWDSLAAIYRAMLDDGRYEPIVATLARKLTGELEYGNEQLVHDFLVESGVEHVRLNSTDQNVNLSKLKALRADYIFLNYPWQRNYPPQFRPDVLARIAHLAYVPYFLAPLVNEEPGTVAGHLYEQRLHQLASLIFVQDQETRRAFESTRRGASHVYAVGSPKLDELRAQTSKAVAKRLRRTKLRKYEASVLWAPHHSYSPAWLNFGRFALDYEAMLELAQNYPRIKITLRPHPFLFGTLIDRGVITQARLDDWLQAFDVLSNTRIAPSKPFYKQFAKHDVLLTDGISFLAEYPLLMNQPAVFIENEAHWQFNRLGELAAECNLRIKSIGQFKNFLDLMRLEGRREAFGGTQGERRFEAARAALRAELDPHPGSVAKTILKIVESHHEADSPLVDPSTVAEVAWEDRPGREPRTD